MEVIPSCEQCLYDQQARLTDDAAHLAEVKKIIASRDERDTAPYLYYLLIEAYERRFGKLQQYKEIKKQCNDLVLKMEDAIEEKIESASDPLLTSFAYNRIGNYIDFAAMENVEKEKFLSLFHDAHMNEAELLVWESFLSECEKAERFLLITDNCGEIVLDKLFLKQLVKRFPQLTVTALVRGGEVLNDASMEDAVYVGLDRVARVVSNGTQVPGTMYELMSAEGKQVLDEADVILSKGQGNYETLAESGRHIFFSFLCKCAVFTEHFHVPQFTGMFVEER